MIQMYPIERLAEAARHSNLIERIPPGELADRHLLALVACRTAVEEGELLHPRTIHSILFTKIIGGCIDSYGEDVIPGEYRNVAVRVRDYIPPPADQVQRKMVQWQYEIHSEDRRENLSLWTHHVWFESIHPFVDGNGRVGRMIWWSQQMLAGEPLEIIKYADRLNYYERLETTRRELNLP